MSSIGNTKSEHTADIPFTDSALISALPALTAFTYPFSETVATVSSDDDHIIVVSVALSGVYEAFNCKVFPSYNSASVVSRVISVITFSAQPKRVHLFPSSEYRCPIASRSSVTISPFEFKYSL